MMNNISFREYKKSDRNAISDIIRETWKYDRFCSHKTAQKLSKVYLDSCLTNQTFTQVVLVDDIPAGIIMAKDIKNHRCPVIKRLKMAASIFSLIITKEGLAVSKIFGNVETIDKELLNQCQTPYGGELAFFAVSPKYRGQGLGEKLFKKAVNYMQSQNISDFYLFTDTSCNYGFYEHQGMKRKHTKKYTFDIKSQLESMNFFIYDYHCQ